MQCAILVMAYLEYPSVIDIDETEMAGNFGPNAEGTVYMNNWGTIQLNLSKVRISYPGLRMWLKMGQIIIVKNGFAVSE